MPIWACYFCYVIAIRGKFLAKCEDLEGSSLRYRWGRSIQRLVEMLGWKFACCVVNTLSFL